MLDIDGILCGFWPLLWSKQITLHRVGLQILSHLMIKISDMGTDWDNGRTITADVYHSSSDMICGRALITNFAGFALNYASFCVPGYFAGGDAANLMRSPQIINAHLD